MRVIGKRVGLDVSDEDEEGACQQETDDDGARNRSKFPRRWRLAAPAPGAQRRFGNPRAEATQVWPTRR